MKPIIMPIEVLLVEDNPGDVRLLQEYLRDVKGQVNGDLLTRAMRYAIERQRSEQRIREQAALLDIATDAIFVQNLENEILFWNKGAERLYGWKVEEARGKNVYQLLYEEPALEIDSAQTMLAAQGEWQKELTRLTKSAKESWLKAAGQWYVMPSKNLNQFWLSIQTLHRKNNSKPKFYTPSGWKVLAL